MTKKTKSQNRRRSTQSIPDGVFLCAEETSLSCGTLGMMNTQVHILERFGFDPERAAECLALHLDRSQIARVISEQKGLYVIARDVGESIARVTGKQLFTASSRADYPAVGDWVEIDPLAPDQAVIVRVLTRRTILERKQSGGTDVQIIGTNIDIAFVVESFDRDYNLNRIERYIAIARTGGIEPMIIMTKTDLLTPEERAERIAELQARFEGVAIIPLSTHKKEGVDALLAAIVPGKTYCFVGSSGVGKSSLINALRGDAAVKVAEIGAHSRRGKHTTTARTMYVLEHGGIVIDNPGMREVGVTQVEEGVAELFDDIAALAADCKFADCAHEAEPGCAIRAALESGTIDEARFRQYVALEKEAAFFAMNDQERRVKDRQFGKFIKKAKDGMKRNDLRGYGS